HSIDDFHVSLDAPNQKIYSMQRGNNTRIDSVINGIKNLREQGLRVTIKVVITKINQHCLEELVELGKSLGAERVNFAVFKPVGRGMENLLRLELSKKETKECVDRIYELKENNPQIFVSYDNAQAFCHPKSSPGVYKKICGGYYIRINEDGNITPCPFIDKSAGNILKTSIAKAWKHRVFEDLRKFSLATSLNGKCEKCKEREVCTGGCRARPLAKNLSIRSYDPLCWR
ncbi:MAG: radical SAM protein, partial [Candidatus Diapherotrites archaeon]|nr:radical SAM protein [Candidatus Diapherotrites archaeon]